MCKASERASKRRSAPLRRTRGDGAARTRDGGPSSAAAAWRLAARGQRRVARTTGRHATRHLGATWVLGGCSSTARREPRGRAGCVASERTRDGVGGAQESHTRGEAPKPSPRECILSCEQHDRRIFHEPAHSLQGGPRGGGTSTSRRTAVKTEHGLTPTRREDLGGA